MELVYEDVFLLQRCPEWYAMELQLGPEDVTY